MNSSNKPYSEESQDDFIIREFKENLTQGDLIWHKDREDRLISPINKTDWMIQIDNELPKVIKENTFIPKEVFHRLLKGTGNLELKIVKNPQI
jgi:hypothetical protein